LRPLDFYPFTKKLWGLSHAKLVWRLACKSEIDWSSIGFNRLNHNNNWRTFKGTPHPDILLLLHPLFQIGRRFRLRWLWLVRKRCEIALRF
jgi:hypothetical protein